MVALPIVTATPERNDGHHIPIDHYEAMPAASKPDGVPPIFDEAAYLRPVCYACTVASSRPERARVTSARIIRDLALDRYVVLSRCHGRVSIAILEQATPPDAVIRNLVVFR
jgi:hypothetical protein